MSRKLLLIAVPRTGSMSMIESLLPLGLHAVKYDVGKCDNTFNPKQPMTTFYHASIPALIEAGVITTKWRRTRLGVGFLRNPWDRLVSLYEYLFHALDGRHTTQRNRNWSFGQFAEHVCTRDIPPVGPYNWLGLSQAQPASEWLRWVNFIGRFERIDEDWERLCKVIGIEAPLRHINATKRGDYRDYYTPALRNAVAERYAADIKLGGYVF